MSNLHGWDMFCRLYEQDIKRKEDVLVGLIHVILTSLGYRCIGLGDDTSLTGSEVGRETLPENWSNPSSGERSYSLRYVYCNDLYILRGIVTGENIVFNLLRVVNMDVTSIGFNTNQLVESLKGSLAEMIPTHEAVIARVKAEFVKSHKETATQTDTQARQGSSSDQRWRPEPQPAAIPCVVGPPHIHPAAVDPFWRDPERDPLQIGRNDLDPLGRGGGGMIFNPFQPHGGGIPDPGLGIPGSIPPGSVPPGARFDPFGPPGFPDRPRPRPRPPPDADGFGGGGLFW